jgi:hypothetical protein
MGQNELQLLQQILRILRKMNGYGQEDINISATDFNPIKGFYLYVGVGGRVVGIDSNGTAVNRYFTAGYHPFIFKQITKTGTTATDMAAMYPVE